MPPGTRADTGSVVLRLSTVDSTFSTPRVELLWIPLGAGAGGAVVRRSGRAYEALVARRQHRAPQPLFHAALTVRLAGVDYVVEMAPVWDSPVRGRGVVAEGPVGLRVLGRSQLFRYEVRLWRGGTIPDAEHAVSVVVLPTDASRVHRLLELAPEVPCATWGRDELGTGDMWNSNSLVAWLLVRSGHDVSGVVPPSGGRPPGWSAGLVVAGRAREPERRPVLSSI